jgi:hypothetical protein
MVEEETPTPTQDKQITVAVPEDRVAEFYAFYSRFLAGRRGRRGRGPGRHGHGRHGRRCGENAAPAEPEATQV